MIVLFGTKFLSGFLLLPEEKPSWALGLHRQPVIDVTLILLFSLHVCFGLKVILFEIGFRRERILVGRPDFAGVTAGKGVDLKATVTFHLKKCFIFLIWKMSTQNPTLLL